MARRRGQVPFLGSEALAGIAAVSLLLAPFLSFIYEAIPKGSDGLTNLPLTLVVLLIAAAPIIWVNLYRTGWRSKQTRLNEHVDEVVAEGKPFTLYLRPFATSGRIKVPNDWPHFGQRMLLGDPWDVELALATVIGADAPLVAIGDSRGGFGAAKLATSDADWRHHMRRLAQGARLILAVPLDRPSTLWEMQEINASDALREKTVFVMPPSSRFYDFLLFFFRWSVAARWRRSARQLATKGLSLPRYRHRGGFFLIGPDGQPSILAGFRNFKPDYIDNMLNELAVGGALSTDRIARFEKTYGGTRWLRPRLFGGVSLLGIYTPNGLKRFVLFVVFWALFSTLVFHLRSIPSEHMLPTLQVGDRVVIANFAYGYNRSSVLFGLGLMFSSDDPANPDERLFGSAPRRGDIVVLQRKHDDRVTINRVVGLPGDVVQMKAGRLLLNGREVERTRVRMVTYPSDFGVQRATQYREQLPGERGEHLIHEFSDNEPYDETPEFAVPPGHVFVMGDNRDNAEDSRAPSGHRALVAAKPDAWPFANTHLPESSRDDAIGFVPMDHLIGRAETVPFTLHTCSPELPPGAECLTSRIWQPM